MKFTLLVGFIVSSPLFGLSLWIEAYPREKADSYEVRIGLDEAGTRKVEFSRAVGGGEFLSIALERRESGENLDRSVQAGETYSYQVTLSGEPSETLIAKVSIPKDFVVSGESVLNHSTYLRAPRVFFEKNATWVTNGHALTLRTIDLRADAGQILSIREVEGRGENGKYGVDGGGAGEPGSAGKTISPLRIYALAGSGRLVLNMLGGQGGSGGAGGKGRAGLPGIPGRPGKVRESSTGNWCIQLPEKGGDGFAGGEGGQGGAGGIGGNLSEVIFQLVHPNAFWFTKQLTGGPGGEGGQGGGGGDGGPGVTSGKNDVCGLGERGSDGPAGPRGRSGEKGLKGSLVRLCIWLGEVREGNCEEP